MKEILSNMYDAVSGGSDRNGSGQRPTNNGGSGSSNSSWISGNRSIQSYASTNSPYGSGGAAGGIWGNPNMGVGRGYSGNGTGPVGK